MNKIFLIKRITRVNTQRDLFQCLHIITHSTKKLFSTAIVLIQNKHGKFIKARALLDSGSMPNVMTNQLRIKLGLKEFHLNHTISGLNLIQTQITTYAKTTVASTQNSYKATADFFITQNISHYIPTTQIDVNDLSIPSHIQLADPDFILWRDDPDKYISTYQLNTVTYGLASSPYLATRCLSQLANDHQETHPVAAHVIRNDFYVDDLLTSKETPEEIHQIKNYTMSILQSAGFVVRKIHSNVKNIDDQNLDHEITEIKTLGLLWQPSEDVLKFRTSYEITGGAVTKRVVLAVISKINDPLGLIGPFIVKLKILLQLLRKLNLN